MKEIIINSRKHGKFISRVDDSDFKYVSKFKWHVKICKNTVYAAHAVWAVKRFNIKMHRLIMGITDPKIYVDHIDHDGLNNQRSNLRFATHQQNTTNRICRPRGTSKYLGVQKTKYGKWSASIGNNGSNRWIGTFKDEESAAQAYNDAAIKYHGEFATLNKIPS